jgi:cation:H+ antiporter
MLLSISSVVAGLILLVLGGDWLVRGAVRIADRAGLSALIVGLVIVGFGTSVPELATSIDAAMAGKPGIAWGNIVGSNIVNCLLVLGCAALIQPIPLVRSEMTRDPIIAFWAAILLLIVGLLSFDVIITGAVFVLLICAYVWWCYRSERRSGSPDFHTGPHDRAAALELTDTSLHSTSDGYVKPVLLAIIGLTVLVGGARLLVSGATEIAQYAGLSDTLIGLTVVAVGTSLPELVTSVVAAIRRQGAIAFGNVVGSSIYNVLAIGGATMLLAPSSLPSSIIHFDLPLMIAIQATLVVVVLNMRVIGRALGAVLLSGYVLYTIYLMTSAASTA